MDRTDRPKSLTELVVQVLRRWIVEGDLELGEALSEAKIAERLEVSRTPVREAFARLEIEGLVFASPQRSTRVFTLGPKDLDDIVGVRCCLEREALTLAMTGRRVELAAALAETTRQMADALRNGENRHYLRLDSQFHQLIFDHTDNVFLGDAYQTVASKIAALRNRLGSHPDHLQKGFGEHRQLVELIKRGELDAALQVLDAHIARKGGSFWSLNDGLAAGDVVVTRPSRLERWVADEMADADTLTKDSRRNNGQYDDVSVDEKVSDENTGDEKRRGRPRVHADEAARKRAWAAGQRAKKKMEHQASGQMTSRGRPRKYGTPAERQKAYEERRQKRDE